MANEAKASLLIQLKDAVSTGLGKIGSKLEKMGSQLNQSKVLFAGVFAGIVGGIGASLAAFGKQEMAVKSLTQALANQGITNKAAVEDLTAHAAALQKVTQFGDETIIGVQAQLATFGLQGEQLKEVTKATLDLSVAQGVDLKAAALLMGKAFAGETSTLSRYGIIVDQNQTKSQKFAQALDIITQTMGGRAAAERQTFIGQFMAMKNVIGDFLEDIGSAFAPIVGRAADMIRQLVERVSGMSAKTKVVIVVVAGLTAAFTGLLTALAAVVVIGPTVGAAFNIMLGPVGLLTAGLIALGGIVFIVRDRFVEMARIANEAIEGLKASFSSFVEAMNLFMEGEFAAAWDKFKSSAADSVIAVGTGLEQLTQITIDESLKQIDELQRMVDTKKAIATKAMDDQIKIATKESQSKLALRLIEANKMKQLAQIQAVGVEEIEKIQRKQRLALEEQDYEVRKAGADAFRNFMKGATQSQFAVLKGIAKAFLIQETIMNTQAAAMGAYKALAPIPFVGPALGVAAAAAAIAFGAERIATIAAMAEGGVVTPKTGGTIARIAEGGKPEAVIPLEDPDAQAKLREALGGGGVTVNINAGVMVADEDTLRGFAQKIDEKLFELKKNRQSLSFE